MQVSEGLSIVTFLGLNKNVKTLDLNKFRSLRTRNEIK